MGGLEPFKQRLGARGIATGHHERMTAEFARDGADVLERAGPKNDPCGGGEFKSHRILAAKILTIRRPPETRSQISRWFAAPPSWVRRRRATLHNVTSPCARPARRQCDRPQRAGSAWDR